METLVSNFLRIIDSVLIRFFVLAEEPILDFFIGSFCLAMLCVVAGELTLSVAVRFNRKHIDDLKKEIDQKEKLSLQAQQLGDRASYKALNKAANDAWGRHFFTMAAYSAGILWPVPFALAWMQTRFQGIAFPVSPPLSWLAGDSVAYPFVFIPLYILARILFKYLRPILPYFRGVQRMLDQKTS